MLVALAIPRVVRMLYPYVWVEDDLLLQSVLATAKGLRPYVDFSHAQMPLFEWAAGLYVSAVGASIRRMEVVNALAIYGTSVLIVVLGRRAVGPRAAIAAGLLFACSSLVFRYHVWAREFFVTMLVLGAAIVAEDDRSSSWRAVVSMAALLAAACAIKLTAGVAAAGLIAFIALGQRRPWRAITVAAIVGAALGIFIGFCYWLYGFDFIFQALMFHFLKGRSTGSGLIYAASILDVLVPLFVIGAAALAVTRSVNGPSSWCASCSPLFCCSTAC